MGHAASGADGGRWTRHIRTLRLLAALGLAGCAGACVDQSPGLFQSRPTPALCIMYHISTTPQSYSESNLTAIRKILDNRGAVGPGDWDYIESQRLKLGLTGCSVLAILGEPFSTVDQGPIETLTFPGPRVVKLRDDKAISITP